MTIRVGCASKNVRGVTPAGTVTSSCVLAGSNCHWVRVEAWTGAAVVVETRVAIAPRLIMVGFAAIAASPKLAPHRRSRVLLNRSFRLWFRLPFRLPFRRVACCIILKPDWPNPPRSPKHNPTSLKQTQTLRVAAYEDFNRLVWCQV